MNLVNEVETAMKAFIKMKAAVCKSSNGPQDLAPMLHFRYQHLKGYCGVVLTGGHPSVLIPSAWQKIIEDGIPEFMIIMTEGYARSGQPEKYRKGQMEEDFKNNPNSDVFEVINIHGIDIKAGNQYSGMVTFKYDDQGQPLFDSPSYAKCEGEALNANLPMLFSACREATLIMQKKAI